MLILEPWRLLAVFLLHVLVRYVAMCVSVGLVTVLMALMWVISQMSTLMMVLIWIRLTVHQPYSGDLGSESDAE
jgi:hypothetical protein